MAMRYTSFGLAKRAIWSRKNETLTLTSCGVLSRGTSLLRRSHPTLTSNGYDRGRGERPQVGEQGMEEMETVVGPPAFCSETGSRMSSSPLMTCSWASGEKNRSFSRWISRMVAYVMWSSPF